MKKLVNVLFFNVWIKVIVLLVVGVNFAIAAGANYEKVRKFSYPVANCAVVVDRMECTK